MAEGNGPDEAAAGPSDESASPEPAPEAGREPGGEPGSEPEIAVGDKGPPARPWYLHPYLAIGLVVVGVILAGLGISGFLSASSENGKKDEALEELAALDRELDRLDADTDDVRTEVGDLEAEAASTREAASAVESDIGDLEFTIAATEDPIRDLQAGLWSVYEAVGEAAELEAGVAGALDEAVTAANQRDVEAMVARVEGLETGLLADLETAVDDADSAIAAANTLLDAAETPIEITEDFEGDVTGWEADSAGKGSAEPADGGYLVVDNGGDPHPLWAFSPYALADVTVEVTAEPVDGDSSGTFVYGVICRAPQTDFLGGYWFSLTGEGAYQVSYFAPPDGEYVDLVGEGTEDYPAVYHEAVDGGLSENRLSVTCTGDELSFSVNGVRVWEGTDQTYSAGRIAFGAYAYGDAPVAVRFDDLTVTPAIGDEGGGS